MDPEKQIQVRQQVQVSTRHLLNSINKGDSYEVNNAVAVFVEKGAVQFDKVLAIPLTCRIPNLTHIYGTEMIHKILTALLTQFSNSFNLIRPMSNEQIVSCAYEMLLTTEEDMLSIEDYVIFFNGAKSSKYGRLLDHLDQQVIFEMLEKYRQERHVTLLKIKDERETQFKTSKTAMGRSSEDNTDEVKHMRDVMVQHYKDTITKKQITQ